MRAVRSRRCALCARALLVGALLAAALLAAACSSTGTSPDGSARDGVSEGITFRDGLGGSETRPDAPRDAAPLDSDGDIGVADADGPALDRTAPLPDVSSCTPDQFIGCHGVSTLLRCNSSGDGLITVSCAPHACNAAAARCNQCDPALAATCNGATRAACTSDGLLLNENCASGCSAGSCNGCSATTHYRDGDGDSYGDPNVSVSLCSAQSGWVSDNTDCDDSDADAHPGQTQFFSAPRKGGGFDFNCDNTEEMAISAIFSSCGGNCQSTPGWSGSVPACGVGGTVRFCVKIFSCQQRSNPVTQTCR